MASGISGAMRIKSQILGNRPIIASMRRPDEEAATLLAEFETRCREFRTFGMLEKETTRQERSPLIAAYSERLPPLCIR